MKYIINKIWKRLLTCTVIATCIVTHNAHANELLKAKEAICEFKGIITEFFNKKNTETFTEHKDKFAHVLNSIEMLKNQIQEKYEATQSEKDRAFLELLSEIEDNTREIYNTLNQKYKNALSLAHALVKVFKKYASKAHLDMLQEKFDKVREHLEPDEQEQLEQIMDTLENIVSDIPKSKIACLARLNKIWKRR